MLEIYRYCYQQNCVPTNQKHFCCPTIQQYFMKIDVLGILWIQISIEILEWSLSMIHFHFDLFSMRIRLDVTMAKRKSLNYIFGKQCNESAEIQRHIITEDIYWCALNVSRLSNGNFKSWWETYKRNCWCTKLYINKSILALKIFLETWNSQYSNVVIYCLYYQ